MFTTKDILILRQIEGLGDIKLRQLFSQFESLDNIFETHPANLHTLISPAIAQKISDFKNNGTLAKEIAFAEQQLETAYKLNGKILSLFDEEYPESLKTIYDAPVLLFVLGAILPADKYSIAIVGTRTPTHYGKKISEMFAEKFARYGITVISGLAYGVDSIAHKTTLAHSSRTIAVLAGGVDKIYPQENIELAHRIAENGAVLSEFPFGTRPEPFLFPRRNRIISGMSLGTLLIESTIDGGGMITMEMALDQNKELFAVPGQVTEKKSEGCNYLIKEGKAKLVQKPEDVLIELEYKLKPILNRTTEKEQPKITLTLFEEKIYNTLADAPKHIDTIVEEASLSPSDVLVNLLSLEFKNLVRQLAGKMFMRM